MKLGAHAFTLRQLQYALAVAETRSFSRAAERCLVSQPSLSAQIARLEAALGTRLFERDRRKVLLTTAAAPILERARGILDDVEDLADLAQRSADPLASTIRLGVLPTISPYLLPLLAPALRRSFPRLTVLWVEERTAALVGRLRSGGLDAALVALEAELGDLERAVVGYDPFVLAAPLGHRLAAEAGPATRSVLEHEPVLLLDDGHCLRDQALAVCARASARELEFRATSLPILAQMVAGGAGVTLLPQIAVATEAGRAELAVRPFADPAPGRTLALVWRRRSPLRPALEQLATVVRQACRELLAAPPDGGR